MTEQNKAIEEFEDMRNFAELKALSKLSLEQPLTDEQFERIMMLKNQFFPMSDNDFKKSIGVKGGLK